jgi:hypothetical protein
VCKCECGEVSVVSGEVSVVSVSVNVSVNVRTCDLL